MNTHRKSRSLRASVLAVHGALGLVTLAHAEPDPAYVDLTQPVNTVELTLGGSNQYSAKANEYNGVHSNGARARGGFDLNSATAFDSPDATRWRLNAAGLGSQSKSIEAEYGQQGRYRVKFGYDELWRNQSDSYQTPYLGIGTNTMTLPSNWMTVVVPRLSGTTPNARGLSPDVTNSNAIVAGVSTPPTPAQLAAAAAVQAADLPAFHLVDLFTQRSHVGLGWEQLLDTRWRLNLSIANDHKDGLKPLGAHSHATGGDASSILPIPIDQDDRKGSVGLSYTGNQLQLQTDYEVSAFYNHEPSVTWNMWSGPTITQTMSTAPNNLFQKASVSGNYEATSTTRVLGSASYARSTQNDNYLSDPLTAVLVPVGSAHAVVVNESLGLKLLNRTTKTLKLGAAYKFDRRENHTPVNTYLFYDNQEAVTGTSPFQYLFPSVPGMGTGINIAANTPYSNRVSQFTFDADYLLTPNQHLKGSWNNSQTKRYCLGAWISCVNAADSKENTLKADWLGQMAPDWSARLGLTGAQRKVDYNENSFLARVPMANQTPTGAPAGTTGYGTLVDQGLNGYGPVLGLNPAATAGSALAFYFPLNNPLSNTLYGYRNRISELQGMRRYDQADRQRGQLQSALSWQATAKLELQAGLDYKQDNYTHSTYGLQKVTGGALNLDATYAQSEDTTLSLYTSYEEQRTRQAGNTFTANSATAAVNGATAISGGCYATIVERNANNKIDPCLDWSSTTRDRSAALGASIAQNNLLAGKLDLRGNLIVTQSHTRVSVTGGNYANNPYAGVAGAPNSTVAAYYIPATDLPAMKVRAWELNLGGTYRIDRDRALHLSYGYQYLRSSDWGYEGMQDGSTTQVLPTREQAPSYQVHSVGISYVATLR